jgi:hypothetical protein
MTYQAVSYSSIACISRLAAAGTAALRMSAKGKLGHCPQICPFDTRAINNPAKGGKKGPMEKRTKQPRSRARRCSYHQAPTPLNVLPASCRKIVFPNSSRAHSSRSTKPSQPGPRSAEFHSAYRIFTSLGSAMAMDLASPKCHSIPPYSGGVPLAKNKNYQTNPFCDLELP